MPFGDDWARAAQRLGLQLRESRHPKLLGVEWRRMADALGPAGAWRGAPVDAWMAGTFEGREVLAFWGPGLGETPVDQCRVIVRVDPPLLLGLAIFPTTPDDIVMTPEPYRSAGVSPARAETVMRDPAVWRELVTIRADGSSPYAPYVTDSFVAIAHAHTIPDLALTIRRAAWLSDVVVEVARALPPDPAEAAIAEAWRRASAKGGLAFDPVRMHLGGEHLGVAVEAQLRACDARRWMEVAAAFPRGLGVDLSIRREEGVKSWLGRLFARDVEVGEKRFDDTFEIHGAPSERVREILHLATTRELLLDLNAKAIEVACNDTHVAAAFPDELEPEAAITLVADAARALAAAVPALGGPYRA